MTGHIEQLTERLQPLTFEIVNHPLYNHISCIDSLRLFMGEHVFAVWDFMCLLKELHRSLVSTAAPWMPPKDALSANLIGSILVEEEGDITEDGGYASHFDIYITAMEKIGADTQRIKYLLQLLMNNYSIQEAIDSIRLRAGTKNFVLTTFSFFDRPLHELAAAFVYGREGITAPMFKPLLERLEMEMNQRQQSQFSTLIYYFKRHITLDDENHFPKALKMLENLIGDDEQKLAATEMAAVRALNARIKFLTDIQHLITSNNLV